MDLEYPVLTVSASQTGSAAFQPIPGIQVGGPTRGVMTSLLWGVCIYGDICIDIWTSSIHSSAHRCSPPLVSPPMAVFGIDRISRLLGNVTRSHTVVRRNGETAVTVSVPNGLGSVGEARSQCPDYRGAELTHALTLSLSTHIFSHTTATPATNTHVHYTSTTSLLPITALKDVYRALAGRYHDQKLRLRFQIMSQLVTHSQHRTAPWIHG